MNINNINIDKDIVLKFLGYGKRKAPDVIKKIIDEEVLNINNIIESKIYIEEIDIKNHKFTGSYINECLKYSKKAYAVLYTIGSEIDNHINHHMNNNDMMRGLALDKIGIVALDYINEKIKTNLENKNNLNISYEIYPGNKDFYVENQKHIYDYVRNEYISINEYNQMNPIKSVAMIIGMGDCKNTKSRCEDCTNKCFDNN